MSEADLPTVRPAKGAADIAAVRRLLLDYGRVPEYALCFDSFDRELAALPGPYAPPSGALLLAVLPVMTAARDLYRSLGFVEIPASADASPDGIIRLQKSV